jgi:hypothetical protein
LKHSDVIGGWAHCVDAYSRIFGTDRVKFWSEDGKGCQVIITFSEPQCVSDESKSESRGQQLRFMDLEAFTLRHPELAGDE